jgi:hypothetical protein
MTKRTLAAALILCGAAASAARAAPVIRGG